MNYQLQSLSSSTVDSTPCLHVNVNTERYQFDAPEGAQRTIVQGKAKLRNLNTIFLTSLRPEDTGGLSGMIFTLADRGARKITIIGPENTGALIATMRHFLNRDLVELVVIERSMVPDFNETKPIFSNDVIQVWPVAAVPTMTSGKQSVDWTDSPRLAVEEATVAAPKSAADETSVNAASEATPIEGRADPKADEGSSTSMAFDDLAQSPSSAGSEKKRKRSVSPPSTAVSAAELPLVRSHGPPTPTEAAQPYVRLHPAHSGGATRGLLSSMFRSATVAALRPPELPLLGASSYYSPTDIMPALARAENDVRLSYILLGPEKRGRVDVQKSDALGVPRTRLAELTSGKKILVADPKTGNEVEIRPEDILGAGVKPSATVVVHCPSEAYIESLVETRLWRRWFGSEDDEVRPVHVMWHKAGVWSDARYQAWMAKFGPDVVHLSGDPKLANNHLNALSSAISTTSLSLIDPSIFKRMQCQTQAVHEAIGDGVKVWPIVPLQKIDILPAPRKLPKVGPMAFSGGFEDALGEGIERLSALSEQELFDRFDKTIPAFTAEVRKARAKVAELAPTRGERQPGDDVVVTALGTGSSMPSKYRNVSATHVEIPGHGCVLLDAGEGTLGQLARLYGPTGVVELVRNLKVIFISHLHADHHSGLVNVLRFRTEHTTPDNQIALVGSHRLLTQLRETADFADVGLDRLRFLDNWDVMQPPKPGRVPSDSLRENLAWVEQATGLSQFDTVQVDHRGHSCFGGVIGHRDGWRIVYSGDTKPCESLVKAGQGATLLIHEATLADDTPESLALLERERRRARSSGSQRPPQKSCFELARDKGHSTFSQAVNVGRRMRSRNTLLTHFSQRYPKNPLSTVAPLEPWLSAEDKAFAETQVVALASDFVSVAIGDMWKLPLYTDAIASLFEEQRDDDDSDTGSAAGKSVTSATGQSKADKKAAKKAINAAARVPKGDAALTADSGFGLKSQATGEKRQPRAKKARSDNSSRETSPRRTSQGNVSPRPSSAAGLPTSGADQAATAPSAPATAAAVDLDAKPPL